MKVILLKDTKEGKANQVVEVSNGYGNNYLIPRGLAILHNKENKHVLTQRINHLNAQNKSHLEAMNILKNQIEALELKFYLKTTGDVIHHSITKKQINQTLLQNKINLKPTQIENVKINTLGVSWVLVTLDKQVVAKLKVMVLKDDK